MGRSLVLLVQGEGGHRESPEHMPTPELVLARRQGFSFVCLSVTLMLQGQPDHRALGKQRSQGGGRPHSRWEPGQGSGVHAGQGTRSPGPSHLSGKDFGGLQKGQGQEFPARKFVKSLCCPHPIMS